ncbi:MAG: hypothetical protein CMJ46_04565 [Planctomyces sp.]|nr:hypothetical protein [Planctomyces sp.]
MIRKTSLLVFASLILAYLSFAFFNYRERWLPNGYYIHKFDPEHKALFDSRNWGVVPGSIAEYAIQGDIVYGRTEYSYQYTSDSDTKVGWFILDTNSGRLEHGLGMQELVGELRKRGVDFDHEKLNAIK